MTTLAARRETRPKLARLGFDDGWLILPPTFLNLQKPVIVVDHAHLGDPRRFGLELFGTRDPEQPLPTTDLTITYFGSTILITRRSIGDTVAVASLHANAASEIAALAAVTEAVIIAGNTYQLESTWVELWLMFIGRASVR